MHATHTFRDVRPNEVASPFAIALYASGSEIIARHFDVWVYRESQSRKLADPRTEWNAFVADHEDEINGILAAPPVAAERIPLGPVILKPHDSWLAVKVVAVVAGAFTAFLFVGALITLVGGR